MQSKLSSALEAVTNVLVGIGMAFCAQLVFFPVFGISVPLSTHASLTLMFTGVSLIRSYILRRIFNRADMKVAKVC
jgi:hypothetical protein